MDKIYYRIVFDITRDFRLPYDLPVSGICVFLNGRRPNSYLFNSQIATSSDYAFICDSPNTFLEKIENPEASLLINPLESDLSSIELSKIDSWCKENGIKTTNYSFRLINNLIRPQDFGVAHFMQMHKLEDYLTVKLKF